VRKRITPARIAGTGLVLLGIAAAVLFLSPSSEYIFLPDPAHPVAPLVSVPKSEQHSQSEGGVYFVDVVVRKASLLERLIPGLRNGATLVPAGSVVPCGVTAGQQRTEDLRQMTRSQTIAAVVALRAAGYRVRSTDDGVLIDNVFCDSPAVGKLQPTQVIVAVDGKPVRTPPQLLAIMKTHKPGDVVHLTVRDGQTQKLVTVKTIADPRTPSRPVIGIGVEPSFDAKLPFRVKIDAGGVGGPSAGLAFALGLMEELGKNVDRGHKVAATGELLPDGTVGPIGGVKQKTIGAREAHVDVFLVPGENYTEARKYAHGLKVVPVQNFRQALRALATLRPAA
jgi:PDZ domain-containing protein